MSSRGATLTNIFDFKLYLGYILNTAKQTQGVDPMLMQLQHH